MKFLDQIVSSKAYYFILLLLTFVFTFLFSFSASPIYLHWGDDCTAYEQMGRLVLHGGTPYIDIFDHKGLLLYLINALGLFISQRWGIFALQALFLFATLLIWDKILVELRLGGSRIVVLLVSLLLFLCFYQGGNYTEDWSLPFISLPLLIAIRAIYRQNGITSGQYFVVGVCCCALTFIRINNMMPFIGFFIYDVVCGCIGKKWKIVAQKLGAALAGFIVLSLPFVLFFLVKAGKDGLDAMLYGMFGYNFGYTKQIGDGMDVKKQVVYYASWLPLVFMVLFNRKRKELWIPLSVSVLLTVFFIWKRPYPHYLMILLPLYVLALGQVLQERKKLYFCLMVLFLVGLWAPTLFQIGMRCRREIVYGKVWYREGFEAFHGFAQQLSDEERKSVFNYNSWFSLALLNHEDIVQCNRIFLWAMPSQSERLYEECKYERVDYYDPQYILYDPSLGWRSIDSAYCAENYHKVFQFCGVFNDSIQIYKRK